MPTAGGGSGGRVAVGQTGEIGADGCGGGGDRDETMRGAPSGKMRPVGFVGAQHGAGGGLFASAWAAASAAWSDAVGATVAIGTATGVVSGDRMTPVSAIVRRGMTFHAQQIRGSPPQ
ncbi:MAG: hypothetical protein ABSC06_33995 [Rhodopila sp.]